MSTSHGPVSSGKRFLPIILALGVLALVAFIFFQQGDEDNQGDAPPEGTPIATSQPVESTPSSPAAISKEEAADPTATAGASPAATPLATAAAIGADQCDDGCLVRMPSTDLTTDVLGETGERPSYRSDQWLWSIITRETVDRLQSEGVSMLLVQDSPETLYLYAIRLPEENPDNAPVHDFGEVLDSVDGHAIVRVEEVPALVTGLVNARIWVEKLVPAAPVVKGIEPAGGGPALADYDLGALLPQVDAAEIERTIIELQGMSSTDGTGIGTRQYGTTGNVMTSEYLFTRMEAYGLKVWYEDFLTPEGLLSTNVIGEIPGQDRSAVYGVMAHLDSTAEDFSAAPGADDNATGMASSLEIARIVSAYTLKHPVHIIFVNAEETAIVGSMAYARNLVADGVPMEGVFNIDSVGSAVYGPRIVLNGNEQSAWMMDLLVRINDGYGLGQEILVRQNPAIVADDNMLRNEGIEAVMVARELFGESSIHHTSDDVIENVSIPLTVRTAQLVLLAIAALVQ